MLRRFGGVQAASRNPESAAADKGTASWIPRDWFVAERRARLLKFQIVCSLLAPNGRNGGPSPRSH